MHSTVRVSFLKKTQKPRLKITLQKLYLRRLSRFALPSGVFISAEAVAVLAEILFWYVDLQLSVDLYRAGRLSIISGVIHLLVFKDILQNMQTQASSVVMP